MHIGLKPERIANVVFIKAVTEAKSSFTKFGVHFNSPKNVSTSIFVNKIFSYPNFPKLSFVFIKTINVSCGGYKAKNDFETSDSELFLCITVML